MSISDSPTRQRDYGTFENYIEFYCGVDRYLPLFFFQTYETARIWAEIDNVIYPLVPYGDDSENVFCQYHSSYGDYQYVFTLHLKDFVIIDPPGESPYTTDVRLQFQNIWDGQVHKYYLTTVFDPGSNTTATFKKSVKIWYIPGDREFSLDYAQILLDITTDTIYGEPSWSSVYLVETPWTVYVPRMSVVPSTHESSLQEFLEYWNDIYDIESNDNFVRINYMSTSFPFHNVGRPTVLKREVDGKFYNYGIFGKGNLTLQYPNGILVEILVEQSILKFWVWANTFNGLFLYIDKSHYIASGSWHAPLVKHKESDIVVYSDWDKKNYPPLFERSRNITRSHDFISTCIFLQWNRFTLQPNCFFIKKDAAFRFLNTKCGGVPYANRQYAPTHYAVIYACYPQDLDLILENELYDPRGFDEYYGIYLPPGLYYAPIVDTTEFATTGKLEVNFSEFAQLPVPWESMGETRDLLHKDYILIKHLQYTYVPDSMWTMNVGISSTIGQLTMNIIQVNISYDFTFYGHDGNILNMNDYAPYVDSNGNQLSYIQFNSYLLYQGYTWQIDMQDEKIYDGECKTSKTFINVYLPEHNTHRYQTFNPEIHIMAQVFGPYPINNIYFSAVHISHAILDLHITYLDPITGEEITDDIIYKPQNSIYSSEIVSCQIGYDEEAHPIIINGHGCLTIVPKEQLKHI